jgi:hypothetical protein
MMHLTKKYMLLIMFLLVPFGFLSFGIIHTGQRLAFIVAFVVIMSATVRNNWLSNLAWYLCAWMIFVFIFRMVYGVPDVVFADATNELIYVAAGIAIYLAVSRSRMRNSCYFNIICTAALIQAVLAISQRLGFDPVVWTLNRFTTATPLLSVTALTGTLGNPNFLAAYLAISLPFFFRPRWVYGLIPIIPVIYLCNTTSAFVPAIIGAIYFFYHQLSKRTLCIVSAISALMITYYAFFTPGHGPLHTNPRWSDWELALKQVLHSPFTMIFGMGPGAGWGKPYPMHNEWLQCLHQFGLIGFYLLTGYVATICRSHRILFTAFIIAVINMVGNYSLHLAPSAFLIVIIAGLIEREVRRGGKWTWETNWI